MTTALKRTYNGIDLVKFLMSICVVAIHTQPLLNCANPFINQLESQVVNMAVPFFFLASGYFLAIKMEYPFHSEKDQSIIKNYLKKMIKLYLIWMLIYLPLDFYGNTINSGSPIKACLWYIRGVFLIGENSHSWMLWYLLSTIYTSFLLLFLLKKRISPECISLIGLFLLALSFGIDRLVEYEGELPTIVAVIRKLISVSIINGRLLRGAFYISAGMLLTRVRLSGIVNWALLLGGFVLCWFTQDSIAKGLLLAVYAVGFFGIVKSMELKDSPVYPILRDMSTAIYFVHLFIETVYALTVYGELTFGIGIFAVTIAGSALIAFVYALGKHRKRVRSTRE